MSVGCRGRAINAAFAKLYHTTAIFTGAAGNRSKADGEHDAIVQELKGVDMLLSQCKHSISCSAYRQWFQAPFAKWANFNATSTTTTALHLLERRSDVYLQHTESEFQPHRPVQRFAVLAIRRGEIYKSIWSLPIAIRHFMAKKFPDA